MAGNPLSRFERNSPAYKARLKEISAEMAPRAERGRKLQNLLDMAGIDINALHELKQRYDSDAIETAIRDFGPEFRAHLPEQVEVPPELRPKESWQNRWERERDARQPQVPNGGKGAVERG